MAAPNNTQRFAEVPPTGVTVRRGPTLDGIGRYLRDEIAESDEPVGRRGGGAARHAAPRCWSPTCRSARRRPPSSTPSRRSRPAAPSSTASRSSSPPTRTWRQRFEERGLPIVGDDIKSQVGATIVHRDAGQPVPRARRAARPHLPAQFRRQRRLPEHARARAAGIEEDLQDPGRDEPARRAARPPTTSMSARATTCRGSTDRKWAHIRLEGTTFGGVPLNIELKLEVWDSPNSAGIVIDAVRCAKLALDRGIGGALVGPSSYFMKSPPQQFTDAEARERTQALHRRRARSGRGGSRMTPGHPRPPRHPRPRSDTHPVRAHARRSALGRQGTREAAALADAPRGAGVDAPCCRARASARRRPPRRSPRRLGLPVTSEPDLDEIDFGDWTGPQPSRTSTADPDWTRLEHQRAHRPPARRRDHGARRRPASAGLDRCARPDGAPCIAGEPRRRRSGPSSSTSSASRLDAYDRLVGSIAPASHAALVELWPGWRTRVAALNAWPSDGTAP